MGAQVEVRGPDGRRVGLVYAARTPWSRMVGLLLHSSLPRGEGLLLAPAWSIHTWGMRMPIDVVFLDDGGRILRMCPSLPPWRVVSGTRQARTVIELGAGTLAHTTLRVGDRLTWAT